MQIQQDSSEEEGIIFYHHLPVEVDPQEFDEKGWAPDNNPEPSNLTHHDLSQLCELVFI